MAIEQLLAMQIWLFIYTIHEKKQTPSFIHKKVVLKSLDGSYAFNQKISRHKPTTPLLAKSDFKKSKSTPSPLFFQNSFTNKKYEKLPLK